MGTEHYIEELLYRYNCVVVPNFGAFLAQIQSAVIQESTNVLYPPSKVVSFNAMLSSNDGLLVSYMANAEGISYEEMLKQTLETAEEWRKQLRNGSRLKLNSIGELWLNREGKIQFQPSSKNNYLTSSFGLSSMVSVPITREVLKEEVLELEEKIPFIITPEERKRSSLRPYLNYAAVALLAVSLGLTGFNIYKESTNRQQLAQEEAKERVTRNIQEATFFGTSPMELPPLKIELAKKSGDRRHHIIAGAFRVRKNADKKIRQLQRKGFEAEYLGVNKYGLHQVTYGSFADPQKALESLKKIKRSENKDAWLLSKK